MADELAAFRERIGGEFAPSTGDRINTAMDLVMKALHDQAAETARVAKEQAKLSDKLHKLGEHVLAVEAKMAAWGAGGGGGVAAAAEDKQGSRDPACEPTPPAPPADVDQLLATVEQHSIHLDRLMRGKVLVVDPHGAANFRTIPAAMAVAAAGDVIVIRPGTYSTPLTLEAPGITLMGSDAAAVVLDHAEDMCTIVFKAAAAVQNVTIVSRSPHCSAVRFDAESGECALEACDVTSVNLSCVVVARGAPLIKKCRVHGSKQHGISCKAETAPTIVDCEVYDNRQPNIVVERAARPVVTRCIVRDSHQNGVWFRNGALGELVDNDIFNNRYSNIDVSAEAAPVVRSNRIHGSGKCGVCVADNAGGTVTDNDIYDNAYSNVGIMAGACPVVSHNRIHHSKQHGILVKSGAAGSIHDNNLWANALANIKLEQGATTTVQSNTR